MTTTYTGISGLRVVTDTSVTYPAWQPGRQMTITKSVGGFTATGIFGIPPKSASGALLNACQLGSFIWNGQEFCRGPDSGSGTGFEFYILDSTAENTQHKYNGVEPGRVGDTPPLVTSTNLLGQALTDATNTNATRVVKPAFYIAPGRFSAANLSSALTEVTPIINTITYTWGLAGNDHIIQFSNSFAVPTDPLIQARKQFSAVPLYHYCPNFGANPFTTQEWVDLTTGATRAYASDTSTTETLMCKTTTGDFACAVVYGSGALGVASGGFYNGLNGGGGFPFINCYGWCVKSYPSGIPAGTIVIPAAFCFGTRADLIGNTGAIVTAAANLPAAVYP